MGDGLYSLPMQYLSVVRSREVGPRSLAVVCCYVLPAVFAGSIALTGADVPSRSALLAAVSIFGGFMFSVLVTILRNTFDLHSQATHLGLDAAGLLKRNGFKVLEQTVSYSVLVAVFAGSWIILGEIVVDWNDLWGGRLSMVDGIRELLYVPILIGAVSHLFGLFLVVLQDLHITSTTLLRNAGALPTRTAQDEAEARPGAVSSL